MKLNLNSKKLVRFSQRSLSRQNIRHVLKAGQFVQETMMKSVKATFKVCGRNEESHGNTLGPDGEEKPFMLC